MQKIELSLILPIYNEGPTLAKSIDSVFRVLEKLKISFEIIFVEDKSVDDSLKVIEKVSMGKKNIRIIYHQKNQGRGQSVKDGIFEARGDICGFMDVDCEISPSYIPIFIEEIKKGYDFVVGKRFYDKTFGSISRAASSVIYALIVKLFLKIPIEDTEAGFKFFDRKRILPVIKKTKNKGWFWDTEICARAHFDGLKISQVPVIFRKRADKKSTVRIFSDSLNYLIAIYKFSKELRNKGVI